APHYPAARALPTLLKPDPTNNHGRDTPRMNRNNIARLAPVLLALAALLAPTTYATDAAADDSAVANAAASAAFASPEPQASQIGVNGFFSVDPAQQGSTFQAAVVMDIPGGLHVNSNKPLGKYAVPTVVKVEAPRGFRVTPVTYPRGNVRSFNFGGSGAERLAVYEGRAVFRFNVSVPAGHPLGVETVRVSVRFQSCNDEVCFPPATRELALRIAVVDRNTPSNRVNGQLFGGGGRRRG
ncbi:MAG TPA: protein-disulfide reductase DsbD domain-containing protein, partial [Pyrinomonadaceae bacterium]|nr:protein-disulfide reductase DsbD domain-containing protein [Pyrinomonadaceae bacterium]